MTPMDGEKFADAQPLFQGTALPNESVQISINTQQSLQTTVQADNSGNWQFRPDMPLDPGNYVFSAVANDSQGVTQTLNRNFTVLTSGSQFNEPSVSPQVVPTASVSATPSPTIVPTATSAPSPTVITTPTINPLSLTTTPNLTLTMAADLSLTPNPNSLTLTASAKASGTKLQPTGSESLFIAGAIMTLFIAGGLVLFFF